MNGARQLITGRSDKVHDIMTKESTRVLFLGVLPDRKCDLIAV